MSNYVNEEVANKASDHGTLLGTTKPCRESKGMWWEVYAYENEVIACVCDVLAGVTCGERVTDNTLHLYCDNPEDARSKLNILRANT